MVTSIINARIVYPESISDGNVIMENGKILAAGRVLPPRGALVIDAKGSYAGPGFVDIHCHGGDRYTACDNPAEAAKYHLYFGTTSQVLSLGYGLSKENFFSGIENIKMAMEELDTNIIGIHFEGPYINPKYGVSSEKAWKMEKKDYQKMFLMAKGIVLQCTYAPEILGIETYECYVKDQNAVLAVGHTEMSPEILDRAVRNGAVIVTHLFDAMGCHLGNDSVSCTGIIQDTAADAVLARDDLFSELICDSRAIHVKASNLRIAYKALGADKLILITDASVLNHNPSKYSLDDIRSSPDLNFNEAGVLCGSRLTMELACQNMKHYTNAGVLEIFKMASRNPAIALNIYENVGSLEAGKHANIILCDENMVISEVYFKGQPIRNKK